MCHFISLSGVFHTWPNTSTLQTTSFLILEFFPTRVRFKTWTLGCRKKTFVDRPSRMFSWPWLREGRQYRHLQAGPSGILVEKCWMWAPERSAHLPILTLCCSPFQISHMNSNRKLLSFPEWEKLALSFVLCIERGALFFDFYFWSSQIKYLEINWHSVRHPHPCLSWQQLIFWSGILPKPMEN